MSLFLTNFSDITVDTNEWGDRELSASTDLNDQEFSMVGQLTSHMVHMVQGEEKTREFLRLRRLGRCTRRYRQLGEKMLF